MWRLVFGDQKDSRIQYVLSNEDELLKNLLVKKQLRDIEPIDLLDFKGELVMATYTSPEGKDYYRLFQIGSDKKTYTFTEQSTDTKEAQMTLGKRMVNKIYSGAAPKIGNPKKDVYGKLDPATSHILNNMKPPLPRTKGGIYAAEWLNWFNKYFGKEQHHLVSQVRQIFGDKSTMISRLEARIDGKENTEPKQMNPELAGKLFRFFAENPFDQVGKDHVGGLIGSVIQCGAEYVKVKDKEKRIFMLVPAYEGFVKALKAFVKNRYRGSLPIYVFNGVRREVSKVLQEEDGYYGRDMKNIQAYKKTFKEIMDKNQEAPTPEQTWEYIFKKNLNEYDQKAGTFAKEPTLQQVYNAVAQDRGLLKNPQGLLKHIESFKKQHGREPMYDEDRGFIRPYLTKNSYLASVKKYLCPSSSF